MGRQGTYVCSSECAEDRARMYAVPSAQKTGHTCMQFQVRRRQGTYVCSSKCAEPANLTRNHTVKTCTS
eukprot:1160742-Pelagomonas_calceolata.AAC.9